MPSPSQKNRSARSRSRTRSIVWRKRMARLLSSPGRTIPRGRRVRRRAGPGHDLVERHVLDLSALPQLPLDRPGGEAPPADGDPEGETDQIGVLELHARALVAVVEEDVQPGGVEGAG